MESKECRTQTGKGEVGTRESLKSSGAKGGHLRHGVGAVVFLKVHLLCFAEKVKGHGANRLNFTQGEGKGVKIPSEFGSGQGT